MASANFYNNSALMFGIDLHAYQAILSPLDLLKPKGTTVDDTPHTVIIIHSSPGGDDSKRTPKVTADGKKMIRDGFTIGKVPHIPVPAAPPHPYEAVQLAQIILDSKTTPLLKMATVTSAGDPLSVCAIVSLGANLNCQDGGMKVTGVVICVCSVKTSPQAKDLLFRIFDDFFKKMLIKWLINLFDLLLQAEEVPWPIRPILVWVFKKAIGPIVDWMEQLAKWLWDREQKREQVKPKGDPPTLPPKKDDPPEDWRKERDRRREQEQKDREERQRKRDEERQRERNTPWWQWW